MVERIKRLRSCLDLKTFGKLGGVPSDLIILTVHLITKRLCRTVQHFPKAIINRAGDRHIFLGSASILLMVVYRRITLHHEFSSSPVRVVSLLHQYYFFIRFRLCL